jgi:branched-chain amino acid transport system substrate-binding protein
MENKNGLSSVVSSLGVVLLITSLMLLSPALMSAQTRTAAAKEEEPYKIGATLALTGYSAGLGVSSRNGVVLAIDEINKKGGIKGRKLEGIIYDNKSDDSTAVLNAIKLVEKDKVDALIVGTSSASCFAVLGTIDRLKTPMFFISPATKMTRPTKLYSFSVVPCVDVEERTRARWIKAQGYTKVGLLWLTSPTGEEDVEYFEQEAKNFGLTIVANEQHKGNDTDMSVQLSRIAAAKPDVIWFVTYPHPGAIIAKNIKSLGMNIPLIGCYGMTSEAWIKIAKETAEGWYGCIVSHELGAQTPPWKPTYPIVKAYAESFHSRFGESTTSSSGNCYDSVYMIAAGLKEMGDERDVAKRREKLARAIENLERFFGLNGPYYMSASNHNGTGEWAISLVKIVNGKMVLQ